MKGWEQVRTGKILTGVVSHISVGREPGDVKALQHGRVPRLPVNAVVQDVVHGGSRNIADGHFTLKHTKQETGDVRLTGAYGYRQLEALNSLMIIDN